MEDRLAPALFTVTNTNDSGDGSFRQAITDANNDTRDSVRTVQFHLPVDARISLSSPLPPITQKMDIFADGFLNLFPPSFYGSSRPDYYPGLEILGDSASGTRVSGLNIWGFSQGIAVGGNYGSGVFYGQPSRVEIFDNTFRVNGVGIDLVGVDDNVIIHNTIVGSDTSGIRIRFSSTHGADSNNIEFNRIGVDKFNNVYPNNLCGVEIEGTGSGNLPVTMNTLSYNEIAGNGRDGVYIHGLGAYRNSLQKNLIGLILVDPLGSGDVKKVIPNGGAGVSIVDSPSTLIGGVGDNLSEMGNTISGNRGPGIYIGTTSGTTINLATSIEANRIEGNALGIQAVGVSGTIIGNVETRASANVIVGNQGAGIAISGVSSTYPSESNIIGLNFIGTDERGAANLGNGDGILLTDCAGAAIGSPFSRGNVISGNRGVGLSILRGWQNPQGGYVGNITVSGTYIGTDPSGNKALGNGTGILITQSMGNEVGLVSGNLISGNTRAGITLVDTGSNSNAASFEANIIGGNFIGTNADGTAALGNGAEGILVEDSLGFNIVGHSEGNIIGGANSDPNIISGNGVGVSLVGMGTTHTVLKGNFIGTDKTGTHPLPNHGSGVSIFLASNNLIGGTASGEGNAISGNGGSGVFLLGEASTINRIPRNTLGNLIQGNFIGVGSDGVTPLGNRRAGVEIQNEAEGNFIGGTDPHAGNIIANTTNGPGVSLHSGFDNHSGLPSKDSILGNVIYGNSTGGINLLGSVNQEQNYPKLTSALYGPDGTVTITGYLAGPPIVYRLEFFSNPPPGSSGSVQGRTFLGALVSSVLGGIPFKATFQAMPEEGFITATATDPDGNTSEFSPGLSSSVALANPFDNNSEITINSASNTVLNPVISKDSTQGGLAGSPPGFQFPLGFLKFKVAGVTLGVPFTVTINLPHEERVLLAPGETAPRYYKFGPKWNGSTFDSTPSWYDFSFDDKTGTGAKFADTQPASHSGTDGYYFNQITLYLKKGTRGDDDPADKGPYLTDPGGVALPPGSIVLGDAAGASSLDHQVTNTNDDGPGSLRQAIIAANNDPTGARIVFHIHAGEQENGAYVIRPLSALPALNNQAGGIVIDGTTQTSFGGNTNSTGPEIVLDGSQAGPGNGLEVYSSYNRIAGLDIRDFQGSGIEIDSGAYNVVAGCYLGTNALGTQARPNLQSGILLKGGATGNIIGGTTTGAGNIISGNNNNGVRIESYATTAADNNRIIGNYIGTNAAGLARLGNKGAGVFLAGGLVSNTHIGGTSAAERNVIADNLDGIWLQGWTVSGTVIQGNYIGTDKTGNAALGNNGSATGSPNEGGGIEVLGAASTIIGGLTAMPGTGAGNVISGNGAASGDGIWLRAGTNTTIQGNLIGLGADGSTVLRNYFTGIEISNANGSVDTVQVGGSDPQARNVISGNRTSGVNLTNSGPTSVVTNITIQGNNIGTDATGLLARGNGADGVTVAVSGASVRGNVISANHAYGVNLYSDAYGIDGTYSVIAGNLIGVNKNGTTALPNGAAGVILLRGARGNFIGGSTTSDRNIISGNTGDGVRLTGDATIFNVVAGNYIGTNAAGNAALGNGQAGIVLDGASGNVIGGGTVATRNVISANQHGIDVVNHSSWNQIQGNYVGTDATGEFKLGNLQGGIYLLSGSDNNTVGTSLSGNVISGNGFLGILLQNVSGTVVQGNYIGTDARGTQALGNGPGDQPIVGSSLFGFTGLFDFLARTNTALQGSHIIQTLGNGPSGVQLGVGAVGNWIGGDAPGTGNLISGNKNAAGIQIDSNAARNLVGGNIIGLSADHTHALANQYGVVLKASNGSAPTQNVIGGNTQGAGNVISGNTRDGVELVGAGVTGNVVQGNAIGTNANEDAKVGNAIGVALRDGASGNIIGGTTFWAANVIGGNLGTGVLLTGLGTNGNTLAGNYIGTDPRQSFNLGNAGDGVLISNKAAGNTIGILGAGNLITFNGGAGVHIMATAVPGNPIRFNNIYGNAGAGIAARYPAAPQLSEVVPMGLMTRVSGSLTGSPGAHYTLDVYISVTGNTIYATTGPLAYLGSIDITLPTAPAGTMMVTQTFSSIIKNDRYFYSFRFGEATATDANGNTSAFSGLRIFS